MGQNYSQLTTGERNQFYALRKAKIPMTKIAYQLNRSRTTLYNELARNTGGRGYRPRQAQQFAEQRRAEKVQPLKMTPEVVAYIEEKLRIQWSPEQIANFMKTDPDGPGVAVSHETVYQTNVLTARCTRICGRDTRNVANDVAARIHAVKSVIAWTLISGPPWSKPASGSAIGRRIWSVEPARRATW